METMNLKKNTWSYYSKFMAVSVALLLCTIMVFAQQKDVKGTVLDTNGETVIGASVVVVGAPNVGTVTDLDGNFQLKVPVESKRLRFSYIGMRASEFNIPSNGVMKVMLQDESITLKEVVAVGYGTVRKKDLTGSVTNLSDKNFNKGVVTSVDQMVSGQVAGLVITKPGGDPTTGATMRLRGTTSLLGGNGPLVVIDGVPGASMNIISPEDVESISVLKDASAAAIYGARSANGIIIITTKKGREGAASISYNGYFSLENIANNLDMLSAEQWRSYVKENNLTATDYGGNTEWHKEIFRTGYSQSHNLSLTGGSKTSKYRAGITFLDQKGIILNNDLQRFNANFSLEQKALDDKLTVNLSLNGTFEKWHDVPDGNVYTYAYNLNPTMPIYDEDGNYKEENGMLNYNPVAILNQLVSDKSRNYLQGRLAADYKIFPFLSIGLNGSMSRNDFLWGYYAPSTSRPAEAAKGIAKRETSEDNQLLFEGNLTFDKTFAEKHKVNVVVGYSFQEFFNEGFSAQNRDFVTDLFTYNNLSAGNNLLPGDIASQKNSNRLISFYGRANYSYDSKYMLTATLRRDGSSKFGVNNRWGYFPSVSAAWRISQEKFMSSLNFIEDLKLRVSYGVTGNQDIPNYKTLAMYGTGGYYYSNGQFYTQYSPNQNANPNLKWEQTSQFNVGLDFHLWNGLLRGSIEYYNKYTKNLLYDYPVPTPPYQYGTMIANVGEVSNKGFEITLETTPVRTKNFQWDMSVNVARNKNMLETLSNDEFQRDIVYTGARTITGLEETSQVLKPGSPIGTFYGAKYIGKDENGIFQYADISKDGKYVYADDRTEIGCAQPDFTANMSHSFQYKNFFCSFLLRGVFGNDVLNGTALYLNDANRLPGSNILDSGLKIVKQPLVYSSYYIEDGSFVRLENIQLGYNFKLRPGSPVKNLKLTATANNLFIITKYSGIDPEVSQDGLVFGIDARNYYPKTRSFSLGLNVTF